MKLPQNPTLSGINTYHVEYVIADKLAAGIHVEEMRVGQRRWPNEGHGKFSVHIGYRKSVTIITEASDSNTLRQTHSWPRGTWV